MLCTEVLFHIQHIVLFFCFVFLTLKLCFSSTCLQLDLRSNLVLLFSVFFIADLLTSK